MPTSVRQYKDLRSRTTRKFRGENPDGPPGTAFTDAPGQLEQALNINPEAEGLRETVAEGDGDAVPEEPVVHAPPGEAEDIAEELQDEGDVNPKRREKNEPFDIHKETGEVPGGTVHEGPATPHGMEGYSGGDGGGGAPAGGGVVASSCDSDDPRESEGYTEGDERSSMGCGPESSKEKKKMTTKKDTIPEVTLAEVEIVKDGDKDFVDRLREAMGSIEHTAADEKGDEQAMALEMGDPSAYPAEGEPEEMDPTSEQGVEFGAEMSGEELPPLSDQEAAGPCPESCVPETAEEIVQVEEADVTELPGPDGAPEELPASAEGVEFGAELSGDELPASKDEGSQALASTEEKEEDEEKEEEKEDEKEAKEASTETPESTETVYETLGNIEALAGVRADRVTLVRANENTDDPHYLVLVDGDPIAKVALSYQPESLQRDHSELFTGEDYPKFVLEGIQEFGLAEALQHVHARLYAAAANSGDVASQMRQAAVQDMEVDHRQRLADMKDGLINTAEIVLQGSLKNYILENPLKDSLVSLMLTAGVHESAAVNIVEDAWQTSAGNYFTAILKKAEEWLGAAPEVLEHHMNEIQGMSYRRPQVTASDEIAPAPVAPEHVPVNVPVQTYASAQPAPQPQGDDWTSQRKEWGKKLNLHGRVAQASLANYSYRGRK